MGFFARQTYKGICRAMLRSYRQAGRQNQDVSERELLAVTLSQRPTYKRKTLNSFTFSSRQGDFEIGKTDTIRDVIRNVIIRETVPLGASRDPQFAVPALQEISEVINKELKGQER